MFKKALVACAMACFLFVAGCAFTSQPIQEFTYNNVDHASVSKIRETIIKAGQERNWSMQENKKGVITAKLHVRDHEVVVDIPYNSQGYQINYVSSVNMNAENGKIHRKYNSWVNNLFQDINRELANTAKL